MATTKETREVEIIMNGKKVNSSIKEMEGAVAILNAQLKKLPQGTDEFVKKSEELKGVRQRLKDVKDDVYALDKSGDGLLKGLGGAFGSLGGIIAGGVIGALVAAVAWVVNFGKEAYELAKTYSDAFADIKKSTGMTNEEVQALNKSIGDLDTRTSQLDLLEIAKVGGQIGIAKEQMEGFVESTDKAVVALGDEFAGGAEEVAGTMGTLASLFKETKELQAGDAINQIGSALNELGATGSATAPVVAEFAKRMGQLGDLSPQISQTLGLGAAFQELGLSAEISAGGLSNILLTAAKSTDVFAEHLGMTEQAFKDMINTDPNEVVLKLAESFKGLPVDVVAKRLDALGIKSQEATKVMSLLSNQTDKVREKQQLANKAMADGTSLTNEFNVKNNTDAAIAEKRAKAWEKLQVLFGQKIAPVISFVQDLLIGLFGVLGDVFNSLEPLFGDFFDVLGELGRSLGLTAEKGSFLSGVFKAIGTILNILLIPLKITLTVITALVGGFNYAYQNSKLFCTAIDGLLTPIKLLWTAIKEVISWMGKLAEFAGKDVKVKASVETKTDNTTTNTTRQSGKEAATPDATTPAGLNDLSSETEADRKKEEAARKKQEREEAALKKANEKKLELKRQYDQAVIEADRANEALKDSLEDGKLGKLTTAYNRQLRALEENERKVRANTEISETQKNELLQKYADQRAMIEQKYQTDKAALEEENAQKEKEAAEKRRNEKLKQIEEDSELELIRKENELAQAELDKQAQDELVAQNLLEAIDAEKAKEDALYAIRREALANKLALLQEEGLGSTTEAAKAQADLLKLEKEHQDKKTELVKKGKDARAAIEKAGVAIAKDAIDTGIELLSKDEAARKKNAGLLKAFSIGKTMINLFEEISAIWKNANSNPLNILLPGAGTAIAIAQTAFATARGYASVRSIQSQQFAAGGFTGPGMFARMVAGNGPSYVSPDGRLRDSTGHAVAGLVHEKEWVGPKWMTESPKYANVFGYLEAERMRGKGFAEGGFTSSQMAPAAQNAMPDESLKVMQDISLKLTIYHAAIDSWQKELKVVNNVGETEEGIKLLNRLRYEAGA